MIVTPQAVNCASAPFGSEGGGGVLQMYLQHEPLATRSCVVNRYENSGGGAGSGKGHA